MLYNIAENVLVSFRRRERGIKRQDMMRECKGSVHLCLSVLVNDDDGIINSFGG